MDSKNVLEVKNLHRYLGRGDNRNHVLRGIDLSLPRGKTVSIVGPSGCGKSTLLYLLGLLDHPNEGEIYLNGQRVDKTSEKERTYIRAAKLGFVFQFHFLLAEFSAFQNLVLPMRKLKKIPEEEIEDRALELLDRVGLKNKADRMGNHLSGGERQRIAVARSMVNDPDLILADEPTGNLDSANSDSLFNEMQRLAHDFNRTILIVTHNRSLAEACDICLRMQDGHFVK